MSTPTHAPNRSTLEEFVSQVVQLPKHLRAGLLAFAIHATLGFVRNPSGKKKVLLGLVLNSELPPPLANARISYVTLWDKFVGHGPCPAGKYNDRVGESYRYQYYLNKESSIDVYLHGMQIGGSLVWSASVVDHSFGKVYQHICGIDGTMAFPATHEIAPLDSSGDVRALVSRIQRFVNVTTVRDILPSIEPDTETSGSVLEVSESTDTTQVGTKENSGADSHASERDTIKSIVVGSVLEVSESTDTTQVGTKENSGADSHASERDTIKSNDVLEVVPSVKWKIGNPIPHPTFAFNSDCLPDRKEHMEILREINEDRGIASVVSARLELVLPHLLGLFGVRLRKRASLFDKIDAFINIKIEDLDDLNGCPSPIKNDSTILNKWRNYLIHTDVELAKDFDALGTDKTTFLALYEHVYAHMEFLWKLGKKFAAMRNEMDDLKSDSESYQSENESLKIENESLKKEVRRLSSGRASSRNDDSFSSPQPRDRLSHYRSSPARVRIDNSGPANHGHSGFQRGWSPSSARSFNPEFANNGQRDRPSPSAALENPGFANNSQHDRPSPRGRNRNPGTPGRGGRRNNKRRHSNESGGQRNSQINHNNKRKKQS